jgi:hypothetical protein
VSNCPPPTWPSPPSPTSFNVLHLEGVKDYIARGIPLVEINCIVLYWLKAELTYTPRASNNCLGGIVGGIVRRHPGLPVNCLRFRVRDYWTFTRSRLSNSRRCG